MGLPRELKNFNAYVNGGSFLGIIAEFEEPKLALATEDWRGGGMLGSVKVDRGIDAMSAALTMGGHVAELIRNFGTTDVNGVRVRLVNAYQADDGTSPQAVNIIIGGRFTEIDLGKAKAKDGTEHKYTVALAYYRREVDGTVELEIDLLAGVFKVNGVDRYAEIMDILTS